MRNVQNETGRRRRGAAGGAHGAPDRIGGSDLAQHSQPRDPERRGARDHRGQCRDRALGDRRQLRREPRRARPLARGRRDGGGRAGAHPARPCPPALCHRALDLHPARPQSREIGRDRRQQAGAGAGLRPALRARRRLGAALCDHGRLREVREARLHVEVDAPFGRHRLRADRRRGEQAPPRHALCAHVAVGQTLHGLGDRTDSRPRLGRDV